MSRGGAIALIVVLAGAEARRRGSFPSATHRPQVQFTKVTRETVTSTLSTNGKVEPIEWMAARAERSGIISRVLIHKGEQVRKGQPLVELDTRVANAELSKAEAAIQQARTEEQVLNQGGRIAERQQVDADLARARLDLDAAQKQYQALERLVAKQAATRVELDNARQPVDQLRLHIQALEKRKAALVTGSDKEIAKSEARRSSIGGADRARQSGLEHGRGAHERHGLRFRS